MTSQFIDALQPIVQRLASLKMPYYIGGSFASSAYGAVRATNDVDVIAHIEPDHIDPLLSGLETSHYLDKKAARAAAVQHGSFNLVHFASAIKVDIFCPSPSPYQLEAFRRARPQLFDRKRPELQFMFASPEDVILTKLVWYIKGGGVSEQQLRDVRGILLVQSKLDEGYLQRWAASLGVADLLKSVQTFG